MLGMQEHLGAANAERAPTLALAGHYGGAGINPGSFYGNYDISAKLQVPIFSGRRIEGDRVEARARLNQASNELRDLDQRVRFDVRNALIDLKSAEDGIEIATANRALAQRAFKDQSDRFEAGLAQIQDVVQARETVANSEENYIMNVYGDLLARLALIRSTGTAERDFAHYLSLP
jgi:outer membrane protein TolC